MRRKVWPALNVPQTKWHAEKLKQAKRCYYYCLVDILRPDWHLVITLPQIQFGEDMAPRQLSSQVTYVRTGVSVWL